MRVVSLAGPKGSGKNTLADKVASILRGRGLHPTDVAFADPMRWACDSMGIPFHVTRHHKAEVSGHVGGATGREVLIAIGDTMRGLHADFWADHMRNRLEEFAADPSDNALVIVTDTRRANEVDALDAWQRGGPGRHLARLWVSRPGHDADEVIEDSVRARCVEVQNAGTLADLEVKAAAIASWLAGEGT